MKKILLLFLLVFGSLAGGFAYLLGDYYFQADNFGKIPHDVQTGRFQFLLKRAFIKSYSTVPLHYTISLYEHIPGIFHLKTVCYYTEPFGEGRFSNEILFPGKLIPNEKEIKCLGGEVVFLQKDSSAFLNPELNPGKPHFFLDNGTLNLQLKNSEIFVSSRITTVRVQGNETTNFIVASRSEDGMESFVCNEGKVTTSVTRLDGFSESPSMIANKNCSLTIQDTHTDRSKTLDPGQALPSNQISQFFDGQQIKPVNASEILNANSGPSGSLPENSPSITNQPPPAAQKPMPNGGTTANLIQISLSPKTPKGDILLFRYTLPQNPPMVCDLKTGPSGNGPFTNAYQFQAPSKSGTLDLQKGFQAFYLVLHCTNGRTTVSSNVIPAKK